MRRSTNASPRASTTLASRRPMTGARRRLDKGTMGELRLLMILTMADRLNLVSWQAWTATLRSLTRPSSPMPGNTRWAVSVFHHFVALLTALEPVAPAAGTDIMHPSAGAVSAIQASTGPWSFWSKGEMKPAHASLVAWTISSRV